MSLTRRRAFFLTAAGLIVMWNTTPAGMGFTLPFIGLVARVCGTRYGLFVNAIYFGSTFTEMWQPYSAMAQSVVIVVGMPSLLPIAVVWEYAFSFAVLFLVARFFASRVVVRIFGRVDRLVGGRSSWQ